MTACRRSTCWSTCLWQKHRQKARTFSSSLCFVTRNSLL
ncbi:unnamed protein product, partial [Brassica rapa subsp. trilocularis]